MKMFIAKYHGPCVLCHDRIFPGQVCSPIVTHWAHTSCVEDALEKPCCIKCMDENRVRPLLAHEDHSICDDCWPAPEDDQPSQSEDEELDSDLMFQLEEDEPDYDYEPDVTDGYYAAAEYQYDQRQAREAVEWFCP